MEAGLKWFRVAVVYFAVAVLIGLWMGGTTNLALYSVHSHANLLGWVSAALTGAIYQHCQGAEPAGSRAFLAVQPGAAGHARRARRKRAREPIRRAGGRRGLARGHRRRAAVRVQHPPARQVAAMNHRSVTLRCALPWIAGLLFTGAASADPLTCDFSRYQAQPGLKATAAPSDLLVTWSGDRGTSLRMRYGIDGGVPEIRELALRPAAGAWKSRARSKRRCRDPV